MKDHDKSEALCRSVFKSGESAPSVKQFTEKWIELVNRLEKNRGNTPVRPQP